MLDEFYTLDANIPETDPSGPHVDEESYWLGEPAKDVYWALQAQNRQQVIDMGRRLAEITIPSVLPPIAYRTGDYLPGTNQSVGARAVNTLSSTIMFMTFPPGQPMMRLVPIERKLQAAIEKDPDLYAQVELALSRLEKDHRDKAATTPLASAWVGYMKLLLVSGNALWKHVTLECPTFHPLTQYVVSRDMNGHPLLVIHEVKVRLATLPKDVQAQILAEQENLEQQEEWSREATTFSICRFKRASEDTSAEYKDGSWEYWEETEKGQLIEGTEVECDYDAPPMWAGWCIPVYGQNYGRSYCEEYRGDLYILESSWSSLNDGAAAASLMLTFVKPGGRTSLRQLQKAKNLAFLPGNAEDVTTYRTDKQADFDFVFKMAEKAEQRVGNAFLLYDATVRQAERVTAEEVQRTGQNLDKAMGGLYTEIAQRDQRMMITRFVRLHEESTRDIPPIDPKLVRIEVITGVDAMGQAQEEENLKDFGANINTTFPPNSKADQILDAEDYATRLASIKGIKPDGLVKDAQRVQADQQRQQQQMQSADIAKSAAGPVAGPIAKAMAARMVPPGQQQQPQSTSQPQAAGA